MGILAQEVGFVTVLTVLFDHALDRGIHPRVDVGHVVLALVVDRTGVERTRRGVDGLEVAARSALVAHRPEDHRRVVLVALDHRPQHGAVIGLEREGLIRVTGRACADADGGRLVDDDDAQTVTQVVDLLGVRVVAHPQGVGVQPLV